MWYLLCKRGVSREFRQVKKLQVQRAELRQDAAPGRRPSPTPTGATATESKPGNVSTITHATLPPWQPHPPPAGNSVAGWYHGNKAANLRKMPTLLLFTGKSRVFNGDALKAFASLHTWTPNVNDDGNSEKSYHSGHDSTNDSLTRKKERNIKDKLTFK